MPRENQKIISNNQPSFKSFSIQSSIFLTFEKDQELFQILMTTSVSKEKDRSNL